MLHVEGRAVLRLALRLLSVQAAVHATVAVLCKKRVDGLYPGLSGVNDGGETCKEVTRSLQMGDFFFFLNKTDVSV